MKLLRALALLSLLVLLVGCEYTDNQAPTAPPTPTAVDNNSVVSERGEATCPTAGPCIADFSVSLEAGESVSWVFSGASPPTSSSQAGSVEWPSPGSYRWTSSVCKSGVCSDAEGVVNFAPE